jgi:hypothetical protein
MPEKEDREAFKEKVKENAILKCLPNNVSRFALTLAWN